LIAMLKRQCDAASSPRRRRFEDEMLNEGHRNAILRKEAVLKKGGTIDLLTGLAYEAALRALLEQEPAVFQNLLAIANGRAEGVSEESVAHLKASFLLKPNGSIDPRLLSVLSSSYVPDGPHGPCIVSPFKLNADEARQLQCALDQANLNLFRLLREGGQAD
jgi:hypothetical protein